MLQAVVALSVARAERLAGSAIIASASNSGRTGGCAVYNTMATVRGKTGLEV